MANAKYDENSRPTIITASKNDGTTIVPVCVVPTSHRLCVNNGTSGSNNGNNQGNAIEDENSVSVWAALSSANDGTIIELYADPLTNRLLVTNV